jgi:hypothetical protein
MKIKMFDEKGKTVEFDYSIDARQAAETGRYFYPDQYVKQKKTVVKEIEEEVVAEESEEIIDDEVVIDKPRRGRPKKDVE